MLKSSMILMVFIVACHRVPEKKVEAFSCRYGIDGGINLTKDRIDSLVNRKMYLKYMRIVPLGVGEISQSVRDKFIHYYTDSLSFLIMKSDSSFYFKEQKGKWEFDSTGITFWGDPYACRADAVNGRFRLNKLSDQKYLLEHYFSYKDSLFECRFFFSLKGK